LTKNKKLLDDLIKRRFIYSKAFEIHGGCSGLYDYGPIGCAIHSNVEQAWRDHFILEEDMLEIRATCITPSSVLEVSVRTR
jgi:glycyl-tRNA synthetase